jgi:cytochrome c2
MFEKIFFYLVLTLGVMTISGCLGSDELNTKKGQELANELCGDCHNLVDTSKNSRGPALARIFNQPAGSAVNFRYHPGYLSQVRAMELTWNKATLYFFLEHPQEFLSKSSMGKQKQSILNDVQDGFSKQNFFTAWKHQAFKPIEAEQDRKDIIAYLEEISIKQGI